tara:strand:- start:21 stop:296 length:276 start_codon:yes stop_codon:yes gene_type:complete
MLVEFTKVDMVDGNPTINKVYLNPLHIVSVIEDNLKHYQLKEGLIKAGVHNQLSISEVKISNGSGVDIMLIVGTPSAIKEKLSSKKQILRG